MHKLYAAKCGAQNSKRETSSQEGGVGSRKHSAASPHDASGNSVYADSYH